MNSKRAKELLEGVPANEFIIGDYTDDEGKCCAIGHLFRLSSDDPTNYNHDNCKDQYEGKIFDFVRHDVSKYINDVHKEYGTDLSDVNNTSNVNGYTEYEAKERVIHLLDDMIEAGY